VKGPGIKFPRAAIMQQIRGHNTYLSAHDTRPDEFCPEEESRRLAADQRKSGDRGTRFITSADQVARIERTAFDNERPFKLELCPPIYTCDLRRRLIPSPGHFAPG
jgi:hypothetical protein